jgi:hypothetical protein
MAIPRADQASDPSPPQCECEFDSPQAEVNGPSFERDEVFGLEQRPQDCIDEALMQSFPCSDPPSYSCCHI